MTVTKAIATVMNIAFAITIWFALPIIFPLAAVIGWTLLAFNSLFSLGILIGIFESYT
jgi:hypothetical protein